MSDVPVSTQPLQVAIYETKISMMRRAKVTRAYLLLFLPHSPATLAISGENFRALKERGVPVITKEEARGTLRLVTKGV